MGNAGFHRMVPRADPIAFAAFCSVSSFGAGISSLRRICAGRFLGLLLAFCFSGFCSEGSAFFFRSHRY